MITIITGAPGSGKTLYTISKLLQPLIGQTVTKHNDDGTQTELPRIIYTNVKGLLIDHELIDEERLLKWFEWAPPGSVICFDEVQKPWPPRPNGSKVPPYIQNLETHRHMGVDFVLMTQHPLLVDRNLVNLVGRHLHIRRIANMALAVVYEWDHCSRSMLYSNSISKGPWRYDKAVYKLYKSAEVHTKQPKKLPALLWFVLAGIVGAGFLVPSFAKRMDDRLGKPKPTAAAPSLASSKTFTNENGQLVTVQTNPVLPLAPAGEVLLAAPVAPDVAGCIAVSSRCACFDSQGKKVEMQADYCTDNSASNSLVPKQVVLDSSSVAPARASDFEALAYLRGR